MSCNSAGSGMTLLLVPAWMLPPVRTATGDLGAPPDSVSFAVGDLPGFTGSATSILGPC